MLKQKLQTFQNFLDRHQRKGAVLSVALLLMFFAAPPAKALFGVDDIVYWIQQIALMTQSVEYLQRNVIAAENHFKLMQDTLTHLGSRSAWLTVGLDLTNTNIGNINGETLGLSEALNGAGSYPSTATWNRAVLGLQNTDYLTAEIPGQSDALAGAASVEMTDAFSSNTIDTLAGYRGFQIQNDQAIAVLQDQEQSLDDADNTLIAQGNITNGALMQSIKMQQQNATVNAALLQQTLVSNSFARNAHASVSNMIGTSVMYQQAGEGDLPDMSDSFSNYTPH